MPITLAAEAEEDAHAQLTRRGLKTFLRAGESADQREGKCRVAERLFTGELSGVPKRPKKLTARAQKFPHWLNLYHKSQPPLAKDEPPRFVPPHFELGPKLGCMGVPEAIGVKGKRGPIFFNHTQHFFR